MFQADRHARPWLACRASTHPEAKAPGLDWRSSRLAQWPIHLPGRLAFGWLVLGGWFLATCQVDRSIGQATSVEQQAFGFAGAGAEPWAEEAVLTIRPEDLAANDKFGASLAVDGSVLVIGAPWQDAGAIDCGAAYVYRNSGHGWVFEQKLTLQVPEEDAAFGTAVAVVDGVIAVGAPGGLDSAWSDGAVYIWGFDGQRWAVGQTLTDGLGGSGKALAMTDTSLAVGWELGALFYERTSSVDPWEQRYEYDGPLSSTRAVALTREYAAVAADGSVQLLRREGSSWVPEQVLENPLTYSFGASVHLDGERLVVGAPGTIGYATEPDDDLPGSVSLYERGASWQRVEVITSEAPDNGWGEFGASVSLSGNLLAVGAQNLPASAPRGRVYVLEETDTGWYQRLSFEHSDTRHGSQFGSVVRWAGRQLIVASPGQGLLAGSADWAGIVHVFAVGVATGVACNQGDRCLTGICADEVCCEEECHGTCRACRADLRGDGQDGICGPVLSGQDPEDECLAQAPETCGTTGNCDGAGACARHAAGTPCQAQRCASATQAQGEGVCNGAGQCEAPPIVDCPGGLLCQGAACLSDCTADAHCQSYYYCHGGSCVPQGDPGQACSEDSTCATGFCSDGICCDRECADPCEYCDADGVCKLVPAGQPGPATCEGYLCSGDAPSCPSTCAGSEGCGPGYFCSMGNACVPERAVGESCDPALDCTESRCSGCEQGSICVDFRCCDSAAPCQPLGSACSADADCASGHCVDGVCCEDACTGRCAACNEQGSEGTCIPISGKPRGSRPACPLDDPADPCQERVCDGQAKDHCAGYVGPEVACAERSCVEGVQQTSAVCDASGRCGPQDVKQCAPFGCGADRCHEACSQDSDCAPGSQCSERSLCVSAAICEGDVRLNPDGTRVECAPYQCRSGACLQRCERTSDCSTESYCDPARRQCVSVSASVPNISCQAARGRHSVGLLLWLLGLGLVARRARRRL